MPVDSLRTLARHLEVPERTLRRAAAEGALHGQRISERRYRVTLREEEYLRRHWPLLRELRSALRTEPNARLAVLFGSLATGQASQRSDIDLLVSLADPSAAMVAELSERLHRRLDTEVQLVRLQEAEQAPALMADVLAHGRVLVDRELAWPELKAHEGGWRRRAGTGGLEDSMPDLELP
jgi:predicted nucleotidyltransferase